MTTISSIRVHALRFVRRSPSGECQFVRMLDPAKDLDSFQAYHRAVEPVVFCMDRYNGMGFPGLFHLPDDVPHGHVLDQDATNNFDPFVRLRGSIHRYDTVKTQSFGLERHPPDRCVPVRVRVDSCIGDLHECKLR